MAGRDLSEELFGSSGGRDLSEELFGPAPAPPPPPEGGFIPAVQRGFLQTGILLGDILPAMAARAVGADAYAEKQFQEAAATEKKIQEKYAPAVASYKDVKGIGDAITYAVESVGELVPSILPSLFTGGLAGVLGRGAVIAAKEAAETTARKQIAEKGVEALTEKEVMDQIRKAGIDAASRTALKYQALGAVGGSSLQNIPEVYKNIKDETEEESLGSAMLFGGLNSLLDAALPLSLLAKARKAGIPGEEIVGAWYKRFGVGAAKGFATEGATEAAQEMSSAAAEKFVDNNIEFFSEKNLERFINAGLKGGLGGGVVSGTTDVMLGKKTLTEDLKPLDEDIRNTQSDILARRALLDELRAQAAEEGRNRLDADALKDLGFGAKYSLYPSLLNKDINDPVQAAEVINTLETAINAPDTKGRERVVAQNTLDVINQYLSTRGEPDVGQVVEEPSGAGVSVPAEAVTPPPAEGVGGVERTGVVPPVEDVGAPVGGEGLQPAPVAPVETVQPTVEAAPVEAVQPPAQPVETPPVEVPPTTQELITQQETELAAQMDKFQNLLQEQVRRYGLKDVAVQVATDLKDANGLYSKGLIKLAVDAADPVRDLRHESIHALKELGFFTPAQWNSLVRQAETSWINTYMRNRNTDGGFIEPGQTSRYDAYMDLFKRQGLDDAQAQEALIEEAISDAFGDFNQTKAPAGMLQAILNRMKNFFKAIKETVTGSGVTDPERLFGKIERGEVAAPKPVSAAPQEKAVEKRSAREVPAPSPAARGLIAEVAPNPDLEITKSWNEMTDAERTSATKAVANKVVNGALDELGFRNYSYQFSSGTYEGSRNPNIIVYAPESASIEDLDELSRVMGYVLDQKAMVAFDEFNTTSGTQAGFVKVFIPKEMSVEQANNLRQHIAKNVPQADGDTLRDGALLYGNFSMYNDSVETLSDDQYQKAILAAVDSFDYDGAIDVSKPVRFHSDLIWPDERAAYLEGTRYGEGEYRGSAEGADVRRQGRSRIQSLSEEAIRLRDRWIDARGAARSGGGGKPAEVSQPTSEYGEKREGSVSAVGVHFSQQPRTTLISEFYGAGLKGAELARLSDPKNADIRPRTYFYVDTGKGVRPEAGVGGVPHVVRLNNLYDTVEDALGIVKNNKGTDAEQRATNLERSILDAGFNGYVHRDPLGQQGFAVVIGRHSIPVKAEPKDTKFSLRGGVPLSTRSIMESNDDFARAELGLNIQPKRGIANKVRDIAVALNEQTKREQGAMDRQKLTIENEKAIANAIADEVAYQLTAGQRKTGTGLGWYSNNYPRAVKRLGDRFPELATNRHARSVFTALVAVTSNGEKVTKNIDNAITLYDKLRDGKPLIAMGNRRASALENNLQVIQDLLAKHGTDFEKVLLQEITVKDMNAQLRAMGKKSDGSYLANTRVPAAAVFFGPKLGAFYANLSGSEGYLTMDLWWTRSINRMRGLLLPKATDASIDKLREMIGDDSMTRDDLVAATVPLRNKYKEFGFTTELEHLVKRKEPSTKGAKPAWFAQAKRAAGPAYDQLLYDHNLEKMANTIYKNEFEGLEEAPFTATDRAFMYRAGRRAQAQLRAEGIDLTLADIQAALWYYEKRLYEKLSGKKADDIGYEEAILAQADQTDRRAGSSVVFPERDGRGAVATGEVAGATEVRGEPAEARPKEVIEGKASIRAPRSEEFRQFMAGSKAVDADGNPIVYYHGSLRDKTVFRPKVAGAIFFSPDPSFAEGYIQYKIKELAERPGQYLSKEQIRDAVKQLRQYVYDNYGRQSKVAKDMLSDITEIEDIGKKTGEYNFRGELGDAWRGNEFQSGIIEQKMLTGRNITPVYISVKDPFDYEDRKQVDKVLKAMTRSEKTINKLIADRTLSPGMFPSEHERIIRDQYRDKIISGDWRTIELPEVQEAIRSLKHDGFYAAEEHTDSAAKNLAVYDSKQVVSATGNAGPFRQRPPTEEEAARAGMEPAQALKAQEEGDIRFSLRSSADPAINARIMQTTTAREEPTFVERITDAIGPTSRSRFRAAALNRYNSLGEADKKKAKMMGGVELLADANAESAALLSDLAAGIVAGSLGVYDQVGGVPVYNRHYVVERKVQGPRGVQFVQMGGKIQSRMAAEALARRYPDATVKERGFTAVSNKNNTIKGPIAIFAPLAKLNNPDAYRAYQYWAGVKRGSKWIANPNGQVVEQLFDKADIPKAEKLRQEYLAQGVDFDQIQKEWIAYNDQLVQYMLDTGVISKANADKFRKHGDYLPFYRQINGDDDAVGPRIFQSISAVKAPRKIKGGEDPLGDFLENVVRNTQAAVQAGLKNVAARRAADVGMDVGGVQRISQAQASPVNSFYVLENGEKVYYDTPDVLFIESIKSLGMSEFPGIGLLSGPAGILRNLVTKDPGFMLANMMRDSLSAWATSGVDMVPIAATLKNFTEALAGQSPEFRALLMAGVIGGYDYSQGTQDAAKQFGKELRKVSGTKTVGEKALTPFTSLWDGLEKGTQASDAATRMEVYKKTLKETGNEAEALFRALEVMNFNRKGNNPIVRVLTAAVPFLNARMQGLDVLYRAGFGTNTTSNAKAIQKAFWTRGMYMAALSTMYWMLTHDDEEYKAQEQETRDNNWLFPSMGIKIPIPFEVGVLFKVVPERIAGLVLGDDTAKDFTDSMKRNLLNTLSFNPIPQTFVPIVEATTNFNFFTMRPIVGQGMEGVAPQYQIGPGTSRLAEGIGKSLNMSPMKVDQIIQGYTGTMGSYMSQLIDSIYDMHTDNPKASLRFEQMPVVKRFILDPDARGQVTAYFDLKNSVDEATRTSNQLERSMDFNEWGKYYTENMGLFAVKDYVLDMDKTLKEFRDMKNMVRVARMSADDKRDAILAITQVENQLSANIQILKKQAGK